MSKLDDSASEEVSNIGVLDYLDTITQQASSGDVRDAVRDAVAPLHGFLSSTLGDREAIKQAFFAKKRDLRTSDAVASDATLLLKEKLQQIGSVSPKLAWITMVTMMGIAGGCEGPGSEPLAQSSAVNKQPTFLKWLRLIRFVMPRRFQVKVFTPCCEEICEDYFASLAECTTKRQRQWRVFCLGCRCGWVALELVRAVVSDQTVGRAIRLVQNIGRMFD